ncbi:MAG: tRNA uridine-5-carboxymethylaminomethyl(34) synthesis GTPase MnmE [Gemmatimonadota bacterium]|nr:tRNA uridine-5-carboxymethylaminomethyl(34) synthesis GTPase MnmE [Gemmatimonadota bacterium]MDH3366208.1 tRNA uridine-5-carboxymethylaminomethyl(34) synthesis GTPase MnmE [Gemmatimonadota bacterium]MDH3476965.1 tRNA uridine-5-carboxymethylaminomethyl(34) synthesis GTPase MnmE [Gemmatimonadota bacterium]MDH3568967.1 tRNA uridine-5-carboxymethylaminomethyl(34) synthesis GTPase MnmE [Gemmatimonadota bacterium]MDH5549181.1 tRNA uridine-5-carboxymethylaminomethyl(34) synthesis GTPase MnmE [Gemma
MLSDIIAALATPVGRSALAVIRVSGHGSHDVVGRVVRGFRADPPRTARLGTVVHPDRNDVLDHAVYVAYHAPDSYTGEDAVELSVHGGLLVCGEILGALLAIGARQAAPGEFTRRAVQHGKMDLLQAEAIGDLVDATAPAQRRAALAQLDRGLSHRIGALRDQVLELEALISYDIDFPEEDSGPVPPARVEEEVAALEVSIGALLGTAAEGERLREGALAVIAGRPNTGKSSLFNALLGRERAIVTEIPGTTRDAIEAAATCNGFPFRLIDTAGLRQSTDVVERIGVEVSHRYLAAADAIVFCVEACRAPGADEQAFLARATVPIVLARTKADLVTPPPPSSEGIPVSATSGTGLDHVRDALAAHAFHRMSAQGSIEPVLTRERHRLALERARDEVGAFREARRVGLDGVVAATHLRAAVTALEDVIGLVTTDDVLDRVFATFCVGK